MMVNDELDENTSQFIKENLKFDVSKIKELNKKELLNQIKRYFAMDEIEISNLVKEREISRSIS